MAAGAGLTNLRGGHEIMHFVPIRMHPLKIMDILSSLIQSAGEKPEARFHLSTFFGIKSAFGNNHIHGRI